MARCPWRVARVASSNTWLTRPISLKTSTPRPSAPAMPADSWPRGWRAESPAKTRMGRGAAGRAGRLVARVLEGVEPVEDEVGDLRPRSPDSEDPARLAWMVGVEHVPPGRTGRAAVGGSHPILAPGSDEPVDAVCTACPPSRDDGKKRRLWRTRCPRLVPFLPPLLAQSARPFPGAVL